MVQLHTIAGPGEPAAIVEVPDTVSYTHLDVYKRQALGLVYQF